MSTRSTYSNLYSPLKDPESLIRRRNFSEPSSLFDFEEIMGIPHNNQGLPPAGPPYQNNNGPHPVVRPNGPAPDLRSMEELCQPHIDKFLEVSQHMKQNGVSDDTLRLSLFPYFLTHHATAWYRDTINAAAGGTFMKKRPKECYDLIENITAHHNLWDTLATRDETSRTISSTTTTESPKVVRQLEMMNKNFQDMMKQIQSVKSVNPKCETCGGPHSFTECLAIGGYTQEAAYATMGNHNSRGNSYQPQDGPSVPSPPPFSSPKEVEHEPEPIMDQGLNKEKLQDKSDIQVHKFLQMFKKLHYNISIAEGLALMTKYHKMLKDLLFDKEKLLGLANASLTENYSAVLLKTLPEKLGDPGRFLIPCDFHGLELCMALADLGASIKLMPLSVWKKLSLPDIIPTRMTLELATRSIAYLAGIAEDDFVQVGKFTFPADFVIVDYDVDPRVPLILGRPFLRTSHALVDVHEEELIDDDENLIFHADNTSKHPHKHGNESINMINFIDITCEDRFPEVLKFKKSNHPLSGSTTSLYDFSPFETSDFLLEEFANEFALLDPFLSENKDDNFDPKVNLREIEYLLNQDPSTESDIKIIDLIFGRFTDEPALDYSSRDNDDDLFDLKSDNIEWRKLLYGDSYNDTHSKNNKTKDSKTKSLIDEANIVELNILPPQLLTSDSTLAEESSESFEIATLLSSLFRNEDKVFNPGILSLGGTQIFNDESKDKDLNVKDFILEDRNFLLIFSE
nr:reverse transcriptase domain-containing protein [Tanacetum cinerariifolium]